MQSVAGSQRGDATPWDVPPERSAWQCAVAVWPLFVGIGLIMLANGLQGTLVALRTTLDGFPAPVAGVVMSSYFVGLLLGAGPAAEMISRVGHVRVFAGMASTASVSVLVQALFPEPAVWTVMRVVTGFCFAGLFVACESWLNGLSTNRTRGKLLSAYMVVIFTGLALGQFFLPLADPRAIDLFLLVSGLISCALVPILLAVSETPVVQLPERIGLIALYRVSPLGVFTAFGSGVAHGALFGFGAVYAQAMGLSTIGIAGFMAAPMIGGILAQIPIGRASDRFDRRTVLTVVAFSAAGVALMTATAAALGLAPLLFGAVLLGATTLPLYALSVAHINDLLTPAQRVNASGAIVAAAGIGLSLGPVAVGTVMTRTGPLGFFAFLSLVHALIGLFAWFPTTRRAVLPREVQGPFVGTVNPGMPLATEHALDTSGSRAQGVEAYAQTPPWACDRLHP